MILRALLAFLIFAPQAQATHVSVETLWRQAGVTLQELSDTCSKRSVANFDQKLFLACVQGVREILGRVEPRLDWITESEFMTNSLPSSDRVRSLGPSVVIKRPNTLDKASQMQSHSFWAKTAQATQSESERLELIGGLLQWLDQDILSQRRSEESLLVIHAMNALYGNYYDPHTYLRSVDYDNHHQVVSDAKDYGFGFAVSRESLGNVIVHFVAEGSQADDNGIQTGDRLLRINELVINQTPFPQVLDILKKGTEGVSASFLLERNDRTFEVILRRGKEETRNVDRLMIEDEAASFGYIRIRSLKTELTPCLSAAEALKEILQKRPAGLILDLRNNRGGSLEEAYCLAHLFLPENVLFAAVRPLNQNISQDEFWIGDKRFPKSLQRLKDQLGEALRFPMTSIPMVVLVNSRTASYAELLAGALQDHERAILVGSRTCGKGTFQRDFALPEDSVFSKSKIVLHRTIGRYFLPGNASSGSVRSINISGITPDISMNEETGAKREEDLYLNPPMAEPWFQPREKYVLNLKKCIEETGDSHKFYSPWQLDPVLSDYGILYAEDTLDCILEQR